MMPSRRSRSAASTPHRSSPSCASGQQPPQHELGHRHLADARPVDARVDAVARRGVEVLLRRRERHPRPQRPLLLDEHPHEPVVEGRVGDDVDDGRAGGEDAVLDAQVRAAVDDVVDRPVPAVDRAVVQAQLAEARDRAPPRAPRTGPRRRAPAAARGSSGRSPRRGRRSTSPSARRTTRAGARPAPSAPPAACRSPARRARSASRATARGRRRTASSRRARPAPRRWPARRSSARRTSSGATSWCSCTLVHAASGAIVSAKARQALAARRCRCAGPRRAPRRSAR